MNGSMTGLFITIEGIDGSGKSTQATRLARWLERETGRDVVHTFEPGGWEGGSALRSLILNGSVPDTETELLLFMADRSGHIGSVIRPALNAGKIVLCERYEDSTWAYQVGGGRLAPERAEELMNFCAFPKPNLTVFLDIEPDEAASRMRARGKMDRIENSGLEFSARVASAYRQRAAAYPERFLTVAAGGTEDEVALLVERGVAEFFGPLLRKGARP